MAVIEAEEHWAVTLVYETWNQLIDEFNPKLLSVGPDTPTDDPAHLIVE